MSKPVKITWPKNLGLEDWGRMRKEIEGIGYDHVRIGASDVACAIGKSEWKSPARLYAHLCGAHDSFFIKETTAAGHLLEPVNAARYMAYVPGDEQQSLLNWQHGVKVRKIKKANFFVLNKAYPWLSASLDFVPVGKLHSPETGELLPPLTPIECKHTSMNYYRHWVNGITKAYMAQIQTQMLLTNTQVAVFNVLIDGVSWRTTEIERDVILQEEIIEGTKKFSDIVYAGKQAYKGYLEATDEQEKFEFLSIYESLMPEFAGVEDDVTFATETAIDPDFEMKREATGEEADWINTYKTSGEIIKDLEAQRHKAKANLVKSMGEYEEVAAEGIGKVIYRRGRDNKKDYLSIR